jgi:hypothetical protein
MIHDAEVNGQLKRTFDYTDSKKRLHRFLRMLGFFRNLKLRMWYITKML